MKVKFTRIITLAFGYIFLFPLPANADGGGCTIDSTFFGGCIIKKESPDLLSSEWILSEIDKFGENLPESIANSAVASLEGAVKDLALQQLYSLVPGLSIALGLLDPGSSGPSETEFWAKEIISVLVQRIDTAEQNIKDEMYSIIQEQTSVNVQTVLLNIKQHANLESLDLKMANINNFLQSLQIIQNARLTMQSKTLFNHFDSYHAYLNVVSLELAMTAEYYTSIYRATNPNATDAEVAQIAITQIKEILYSDSLNSSVFEHIASMNNGDINWRSESDFMFPVTLSDLTYSTIWLNSGTKYYTRFGVSRYGIAQDSYSYTIEGEEYTVKRLNVTDLNTYGRYIFLDKYDEVVKDIECHNSCNFDLTDEEISKLVANHKEEYYGNFIKRGYGSSQEILDSWWTLGGKEGNRPVLQADQDLAGYEDGSLPIMTVFVTLNPSYTNLATGDFNGDGRTDMLHLHPNADPQYSWSAIAKDNGAFQFTRALPGASVTTNSYLNPTNKNIHLGDFNGDGRTDMLHLHANGNPQYSWVALSNGDGSFAFSRSLPGASVATNSYINEQYKEIKMGDFNGDGRTDMLHLHPNGNPQYSWVALSDGDGSFTFSRALPGASVATNSYINEQYKEIKMGDFDGDGRTDMLHLHPNGNPQYSWVALSDGDGSFTFSRTLPGASVATKSYINEQYKEIKMGDFNGDGLADMLHMHPNSNEQYSWIAYSKGDGGFDFRQGLR